MQPERILEFVRSEQELSILEIKEGKSKRLALVVVCADKGCFNLRRLKILHFSSISNDKTVWHSQLSNFMEFIWKHDLVSEIRTNLYHSEVDGKSIVNQDLKQSLGELAFKWKMVQNDKYTGLRFTVLAVKRPESCVCLNVQQNCPEPISIQNVTIVGKLKEKNDAQTNSQLIDMSLNFINILNISNFDYPELSKHLLQTEDSYILKCLDYLNTLTRKNYEYTDFRSKVCENSTVLKEFLTTNFAQEAFEELKQIKDQEKVFFFNNLKVNCVFSQLCLPMEKFQLGPKSKWKNDKN